jgi:hypothetical protein
MMSQDLGQTTRDMKAQVSEETSHFDADSERAPARKSTAIVYIEKANAKI